MMLGGCFFFCCCRLQSVVFTPTLTRRHRKPAGTAKLRGKGNGLASQLANADEFPAVRGDSQMKAFVCCDVFSSCGYLSRKANISSGIDRREAEGQAAAGCEAVGFPFVLLYGSSIFNLFLSNVSWGFFLCVFSIYVNKHRAVSLPAWTPAHSAATA